MPRQGSSGRTGLLLALVWPLEVLFVHPAMPEIDLFLLPRRGAPHPPWNREGEGEDGKQETARDELDVPLIPKQISEVDPHEEDGGTIRLPEQQSPVTLNAHSLLQECQRLARIGGLP